MTRGASSTCELCQQRTQKTYSHNSRSMAGVDVGAAKYIECTADCLAWEGLQG